MMSWGLECRVRRGGNLLITHVPEGGSSQAELSLATTYCYCFKYIPPDKIFTRVLLPGKSHGRRSLVGSSPWGCEELDTTEQLHFHFSCTGEGNGNPLQCSCLENPRDRGAWRAIVHGVANESDMTATTQHRFTSWNRFSFGQLRFWKLRSCVC